MNNVLKAAKLDFSLVKPYWWNTLFVMLFPVVFSIMNKSLVYGVSFTMCFIGMTTSYTFSVSEKNGMDRLYGILPIPKKYMVLGRYLYNCAMGFSALLVSLIVYSIVLRAAFEIDVTLEDFITSALTGLIMFTIYTVFSLPGYYKFGAIKGRFFMFVPMAGYIAVVIFASDLDLKSVPAISAILSDPVIFTVAVLIVCVIAFALSIAVSVRILQNKEV